jgi:hypothetical protein
VPCSTASTSGWQSARWQSRSACAPSLFNVKAGGQSCPFRFRCLGCGHFRTDPSYLPELRGYLDSLLRARERIRSALDLDDWARAEAMPSDEEITRLRQLIRRAGHDLSQLGEADRRQVTQAVDAVRAIRRPVHLGMPRHPPAAARRPRMNGGAAESLIAARRRDTTRRRQRVLSALNQLAAVGQEIGVSAVARAAGVDQSFLYRHHDLRAQIHARSADPVGSPLPRRPASSPCWPI